MENVALYEYQEIDEFIKFKKHEKISTETFNDQKYRYNSNID